MKISSVFVVLISTLLLISCSSPREKSVNKIVELEKIIYGDTTGIIDKVKVSELIELYIAFADKYPDDAKTPEYLYSAANISMNFMDSQRAVDLFNRIMDEYPDYSKNAECLFMVGFIYDNNLQDYEKAKQVYQEFLDKYPDDEFADDAQASIDNLGKSLEEIILEFEQKNQAVADTL